MKRLYPVLVGLGVATVLASAAALALDKSLPYRIGFIDYHTYLWVGRLAGVSVGLALLSFLSGAAARKGWFPFGLSLLGLTPLLLIGGVHSGPNPEAWCFNNLRQLEGGKAQLADERALTNGTPVTMADISRFIPAPQEFRCAEGGRYTINSIGSDARFSRASRLGKDVIGFSPAPRTPGAFDLFLCHNSADKPEIRVINSGLKESGVHTWLDEEQLPLGRPWQPELEKQISSIRAVLVFVGASGIGPWQSAEIRAFLSEFASRGCPVIPVILATAPSVPELLIFLKQMTWVDLRHNHDAGMKRIVNTIKPKTA